MSDDAGVSPARAGSSWTSRAIDKVATHPALTVLALEAIALIVLGGVPGGANVVSNNWVAFLSGGVALPVLAKVVQVAVRSAKHHQEEREAKRGETIGQEIAAKRNKAPDSVSFYRISKELAGAINMGGKVIRQVVTGEARNIKVIDTASLTKDKPRVIESWQQEPKEMILMEGSKDRRYSTAELVHLPADIGSEDPSNVEYYLDLSGAPDSDTKRTLQNRPSVERTLMEEKKQYIRLIAKYDPDERAYVLTLPKLPVQK